MKGEGKGKLFGTTKKKPLTCKDCLIQYFEIGVNNDGYWGYDHMAIQNEDVFDVLSVCYPHCDFLLHSDQSGPHTKKREDGLDVKEMGKYWGGKKAKMHTTVVRENGPFNATHLIGQEQSMQFSENDDGPFYLTPEERLRNKIRINTGQQVTRQKTKPKLMSDLKRAGFSIKGRYTMDELRQQARRFDVPLTIEEEVIQPGWVGQNKGLLQVLWERGWIDGRNIRKYKLEASARDKNDDGTIKQEAKPYLLRDLMATCADFQEEISAMQYLFEQLSSRGTNKISLVDTPKYHPEMAGEGIEYSWGLGKRKYRSIAYEDKKGKEKFLEAVRVSIGYVTKEHVGKFRAKCRRYMVCYLNDARLSENGEAQLTYQGIEKFQRTFKCHRNVADQEAGYIAQMWKKST